MDEEADDYSAEDSGDGADKDDFTRAAEEAFPDNDWTPEKISAFKEAMRICYDEYEGTEDMSGAGESPHKGKGMELALVFGGGKGKK